MGLSVGSSMTPPMSCRSSAKDAMSWSLLALTTFAMEVSGPGVSPRESAVMVRKCVYRRPCWRTYQSASLSRTAAFSIAGPSGISMARASANISSKSGPDTSPTARRSFISVVMDTPQPWPDRAEALRVGHAHVGEVHLVEIRGAGHLLDAADLDAGGVHVEEEKGEALVLGRPGIAPGDDDAPVGEVRAGGPDLLAVDDPVVAVASPTRVRRPARSDPAGRLGEELAPDLLAGQRLGSVALLLRLGARRRVAWACTCRARSQSSRAGRGIAPLPGCRPPAGWACRRGRRIHWAR